MQQSDFMTELQFWYTRSQRELFVKGSLRAHWGKQYPELFDDDDLRILHNQRKTKHHFFECLAAVLLFEATGYLSLLEKYETLSHSRKHPLFKKLVPTPVFDYVMANRVGSPDLFVYAEDHSDWYFCEVKGDSDKIRPNQIEFANGLFKISGRKLCLLSFEPLLL